MDFIKATLELYWESARDASIALYRNPILILGTILSFGAYLVIGKLFGGSGFFGGMVVGLTQIVLISIFYCWLRDAVSQQRLVWEGLYQIDGSLFSGVINTGFILFIGKLILSVGVAGSGNQSIGMIAQFALIVICNSLPETLYIQRAEGLEAISESAKFTREHWIEWFIPLFILVLPWMFISTEMILLLMANVDELLPAMIVYHSMKILIGSLFSWLPFGVYLGYAVGLICFIWYFLFRGFLYKGLSGGSRRQRMFIAKQR